MIPVEFKGLATPQYSMLISEVDLGGIAGDQYVRRCAECDRPLIGAGFFPMYRHPVVAGDVFYSRDLGSTYPLVTEAFARAVGRIVGDDPNQLLSFVGWYPDDQKLAILPIMSSEESEHQPTSTESEQ